MVVDDLSKPADALPGSGSFVPLDLTRGSGVDDVLGDCEAVGHVAEKVGGIGCFHRHPVERFAGDYRIYSTGFEATARVRLRRLVYVSSSMGFESATSFPSLDGDLGKIPPPITACGFSNMVCEWYGRAFRAEPLAPRQRCGASRRMIASVSITKMCDCDDAKRRRPSSET